MAALQRALPRREHVLQVVTLQEKRGLGEEAQNDEKWQNGAVMCENDTVQMVANVMEALILQADSVIKIKGNCCLNIGLGIIM